MRNAILLLITVFNVFICSAQSGTLDTTFGTQGKTIFNFGGGTHDCLSSAAIQNDGKIVATGTVSGTQNYEIALIRSNPNGTPDLSFGNGGKMITPLEYHYNLANAIAVQNDDKIVIAGWTSCPDTSNILVIRYDPDGSLDSTFDNDGIINTVFDPARGRLTSLAIQPDNKLVVGGVCDNQTGTDELMLIRYNPNGTLDITFGTGGIVKTPYPVSDFNARCLAFQTDGKIVMGVQTIDYFSTLDNFIIMRYTENGIIDSSFGHNGIASVDFLNGTDRLSAIAIQNDDKILAAGCTYNSKSNFGIVRLDIDGSMDSTFGSGGKVSLAIGSRNDYLNCMSIQSDGKIVIAGCSTTNQIYPSIHTDIATVRLLNNGILDHTFGAGGVVVTNIGYEGQGASFIGSQNNKLIIAGTTSYNYAHYFGYNNDMFMIRYENDQLQTIQTTSNSFPTQFYPNPCSGFLTIKTLNNDEKEICIYDLLGHCLMSKTNASGSDMTIDLSDQPKGVYFIELKTKKEKVVKKVVLQ
ncbi:MAG: hypothetical protein K0Q95_952 [Bacteroidota bacterium]|nr:hypothetical protein [Bacteroidota bacterium]